LPGAKHVNKGSVWHYVTSPFDFQIYYLCQCLHVYVGLYHGLVITKLVRPALSPDA